MMRSGTVYQLPNLARTITEIGSGLLPTPTTQDHRCDATMNLPRMVAKRMWPTPSASDNRDRGNMSNPCLQKRIEKGKQLMLSQVVHPTSGKLNPNWVEWLMGYPTGHTDLKDSETQ